MKKPNLLGYFIHIERYRITSAFGFNNFFEILTNSKTLNFLSKIKTSFVNNKKTKALLLLSSSKGGYNAYSIDGVKGFLPRNQISYSSTNQINLFKNSVSKIQFIWIFFKISKVTILFKNNKKFAIKHFTLFPTNFTSYVKFPLQILSLNSQTKDFFKSVYYKFVIKIKHLFIKLNALNIMLYCKSSYIFILLSCFLNFVLFDLSLYYKCFFFSKTLN